ncbi:EamA family transporter [Myxococcota bacterium]|nr:EamA family transporter [Myxococcota bacterium]MCZ7617870.1 DMT family transporter [Myxococcota bacterium]
MTTENLVLVLISALLHAVWSLSIKGSRSPVGFNLLQLVPSAIAATALPWLAPLGDLPASVWALVAGSGAVHGLYFYWLSRALAVGELSVVYPIARSAPAFVPLVAVPLLGEPVTLIGGLGIAVVVAGMWAVQIETGSLPGARRLLAPGAAFAWLTLAASVGYSVLDKLAMTQLHAIPWRGSIPPAATWYILLSSASLLVFAPLAARQVSARELGVLARHEGRTVLLAAAIGFAGYGLILHALRTAPVSYVVAARQASVLFAVALGALQLRERPTRLRLAGALATVLGVVLVANS